ncbi:MAG: PAS domain S-box protein [Desulfobulbaceae bacterium]|nr:PAS domain S-box protein [Desulfobulbaceae bacterium]
MGKRYRFCEEKLDGIFRTVRDAIILIDVSGSIRFWNKRAEDIFAYKVDEVIGRSIHDFLVPMVQQEDVRQVLDELLLKEDGMVNGKIV